MKPVQASVVIMLSHTGLALICIGAEKTNGAGLPSIFIPRRGADEKKGAASADALPPKPMRPSSRLDQAEVTILPFVQDTETVRIRIAKDDELIGAAREFQRGFFSGHRLNGVSTGRDDANRRRGRLQIAVRAWRHD